MSVKFKPTLKKLSNGLTIVFLKEEAQRTATALVLVTTGSKYELKEENGIAHFLEHMCFKGTERRPNAMTISSELDGLGAEYNAFTGHEYTGYYAKVAAAHLPRALDIIGDIYCNPLLTDEDIEREKGVIADEINMYEDVPMRKIGDIFMKTLYGDQPAGWSIAGTKEQIAKYTRKDILKFRKKHYVPTATTVVVSGNFDEKAVLQQVKALFGKLAEGKKVGKKKVNDKQQAPALTVAFKESDQTHIVLGVRSYPLTHPSFYALTVLSAVLGGGMSSRLFHKIRIELGLGYYVRASNDAFTDHGALAASVGVDNMRALEVLPAILEEFERLANEPIDKEEMQKAKDMLAGRMLLGLESSDEIAEYYGFQWVLRNEFIKPEEAIRRINKVTAQEVQELAKKIFLENRLNLAVIGPWKDDKEFRKLLKFS
jgi:predicted Zn-dependent peptidase